MFCLLEALFCFNIFRYDPLSSPQTLQRLTSLLPRAQLPQRSRRERSRWTSSIARLSPPPSVALRALVSKPTPRRHCRALLLPRAAFAAACVYRLDFVVSSLLARARLQSETAAGLCVRTRALDAKRNVRLCRRRRRRRCRHRCRRSAALKAMAAGSLWRLATSRSLAACRRLAAPAQLSSNAAESRARARVRSHWRSQFSCIRAHARVDCNRLLASGSLSKKRE